MNRANPPRGGSLHLSLYLSLILITQSSFASSFVVVFASDALILSVSLIVVVLFLFLHMRCRIQAASSLMLHQALWLSPFSAYLTELSWQRKICSPAHDKGGCVEMIPWGGLSCCLSAAALYLLGRSSGRFFLLLFCLVSLGSSDLVASPDCREQTSVNPFGFALFWL